jgi:hypothetical protein
MRRPCKPSKASHNAVPFVCHRCLPRTAAKLTQLNKLTLQQISHPVKIIHSFTQIRDQRGESWNIGI